MVNLLLKPTPNGERAFPVDSEELKIMETLDEVEKVSDRPLVYRMKAEVPKTKSEEEQPQVYETKDLVAQPNTRRMRKSQ
jgi:hypothetical protein